MVSLGALSSSSRVFKAQKNNVSVYPFFLILLPPVFESSPGTLISGRDV